MSQKGSTCLPTVVHPQKALYRPVFFVRYMKAKAKLTKTKTNIRNACDDIKALLISKNEKNGDSA